MSRWCIIFGHRWDKSRRDRYNCKRKGCSSWREVIENPLPRIGEPKYKWKTFNIS